MQVRPNVMDKHPLQRSCGVGRPSRLAQPADANSTASLNRQDDDWIVRGWRWPCVWGAALRRGPPAGECLATAPGGWAGCPPRPPVSRPEPCRYPAGRPAVAPPAARRPVTGAGRTARRWGWAAFSRPAARCAGVSKGGGILVNPPSFGCCCREAWPSPTAVSRCRHRAPPADCLSVRLATPVQVREQSPGRPQRAAKVSGSGTVALDAPKGRLSARQLLRPISV